MAFRDIIAALILGKDGEPFAHRTSTRIVEVEIDLSLPLDNAPVDLGSIQDVQAYTVKALTGSASIRHGSPTEGKVSLAYGDVRDGLEMQGLYLSSIGGAGWTVTLEVFGR